MGQKKTRLFHRLAIGKDRGKVLELSRKGQIVNSEEDFVKKPHVFEFMSFPDNYEYGHSESKGRICHDFG